MIIYLPFTPENYHKQGSFVKFKTYDKASVTFLRCTTP